MSHNSTNIGSFLPTTRIWDTTEIMDVDINSEDFKELLVKLNQYINKMAIIINIKDVGIYPRTEFVNGQLFFSNPLASNSEQKVQRQVFRKVINFGSLPNSSTKNIAHNIAPTDKFTFTRIYGASTDPTGKIYIPIPYASTATSIELSVNLTNVSITTTSARSNFTSTYIILEYIKN